MKPARKPSHSIVDHRSDDPKQLSLDWSAAAESAPSGGVPANGPVIPKRSLRETVERFLRDSGVPYISVDEAKRVLFAGSGARLRCFYFVVYRPRGTNWLVHAAWLRRENRIDLKQWEEIFGPGFVAVVVNQRTDGTLRFRTLGGEDVELNLNK